MITISNYFSEFNKVDAGDLPEALQKSHDFVVKSTANGSQWDTYHNNETIHKVIDLYLDKLNQHLATNVQPKREIKNEPSEQTRAVKPEKKTRHVEVKTKSKKEHALAPSKKTTKKVEHIREEVKFIKRFVGLHNKIKSPGSILSLIKALQKSIVQKLIRKTSPLAKEIQTIQDKLVNLYNSMKGDLKIEINDKELSKLVIISGGEEVYPSINIIKRYIGLQGKEAEHKKIDSFMNQIESSLKKKKVSEDDPYLDKVRTILNTLKKAKAGTILSMAKAELNGLEGIVKACGCKPSSSSLGKIYNTGGKTLRRCKKGTYSDARKGACSHHKGLNGVLTAEEMANRKFEVLNFSSPWNTLIGNPAKNFTMMLHGEPGAGKTTLLLKFVKYLANNFGKVLYVSSEEFDALTMTDKINTLLNPFPPNLDFTANLKDPDLSSYDFIILDSVNDLGLHLQDYKDLRDKYPNTAFILILQHTKAGHYRGGKDWEHEIEIAGSVENGVITIYRNRYGAKGSMDFFNDKPITNYSTLKPY